jgi:hypothetical protein
MRSIAHNIVSPLETDHAESLRPGRILAYLGDHRAIVECGGLAPVMARCLGTLDSNALADAASRGARILFVTAHGDPNSPIVTGFADDTDPTTPDQTPREPAFPGQARSNDNTVEIKIDGEPKQLHIAANDELVLQCGRASITMLRNGQIFIEGTYIETYASETNRIKGAQVRIN